VTGRRWRRCALALAWLACHASSVSAQTVAILGMGGSIIEYDGFLTSGAATLTPALRFDTPNLSLGGQGSWTVFESGNQIFQATAAASWLAPARERWRVELSGAAGASRYADQVGSGHVLGRGRLHFFDDRNGGWFSATTGASIYGLAEVPLELAIGAWSARDRFAVVGTLTGTWLGTDRHLDIAGAAKWTDDRLEFEGRAGARTWTKGIDDTQSGLWCEVSALIPLAARVSLALSGGRYPSDPVRRVLGARYATAGLRLALSGTDRSPALTIAGSTIAAVQNHMNAGSTPGARLEIAPIGTVHSVRIHAAGATSVDVMGDFTDWKTLPLIQVANGIWEVQLQLDPGVHRLNVRIDGGEWLVPAGARPEPGEFGDVVGVVVIR
jgi:hypothetical protein